MTSVAQALLFASPPLPDADRLVRVWTSTMATRETTDVSYPDVLDIRARATSFDAVESASRTRVAHTTADGTERLRGESVTPGYFDLIGMRAAHGRLFDRSEYASDGARSVVISHALWLRRYGGRADIVGQPFRTRPASRQGAELVRTIVGVLPERFVGTVDPDVSEFWIPAAHYEPISQLNDRMVRATWMLGRLRPGVTLAAAQAEIETIARDIAAVHPAAFDRATLVAEPFGESWRQRFRLSVFALLGASFLLLLIACANVAALLMARLADRGNEMSVRLALGASRSRLTRLLFVEGLLIAAIGGGAGLALAFVGLRSFAASQLVAVPAYVSLGIDVWSAVASLALVFVTATLFAAGPARHVIRVRADQALQPSGLRVIGDRRHRRSGQLLVAVQIALTFVMLVGAALLARTYQNLLRHDLGYRTTSLLRLALTPDAGAFRDRPSRLALAADIKRTLDASPGVIRTSVMSGVLPPWFDDTVDVTMDAATTVRDVGHHAIGPEFFETMNIGLLRGRLFEPADRVDGARAAVISRAFATRLEELRGRDALGQSLRLGMPGMGAVGDVEVVGIVNDVVYNGPLRPRGSDFDIFVPLERAMPGALSIAVHTSVDPASLIGPLTRELGRLAPTSPQHWISTMEDELALQFQDARLYASLAGLYGAAAIALAVLGVYSVLAHSVARRRHELGLRMAIGATAGDMMRMVMAEALRPITFGLAIGAIIAANVSRLLGGLLFGVPSSDPQIYGVVAVVLVSCGLVAVLMPARRASRTKPGVLL